MRRVVRRRHRLVRHGARGLGLAIFFVPTFFKLLTDRHLTEKRSSAEIKREAETARTVSHKPVPTPHHAPHGAGDE